MGFSLYNIFKAGLLVANGVAVLHPQRFLAKYGFDQPDLSGEANGLKNQTIGLLQAVSYLKVPLIAVDVLVIVVELLFGG
mmetsp:Transcript_54046/g.106732  ORF Transcript_54046/g.106732 Transcript_54046/m.106732 type:complete len:80 (-) Transcript_54046:255-494(-)